MANSYLSDDGVTTLISLTKNELKKKASSVNGVAPDNTGKITLTSADITTKIKTDIYNKPPTEDEVDLNAITNEIYKGMLNANTCSKILFGDDNGGDTIEIYSDSSHTHLFENIPFDKYVYTLIEGDSPVYAPQRLEANFVSGEEILSFTVKSQDGTSQGMTSHGVTYKTSGKLFELGTVDNTGNVVELTPLFATKAELNAAMGGLTSIKVEVVSSLPATGANGTIYLVAHTHGTGDAYDEYLWIESTKKFEKIGNTDIDLSSYAKKTDLDPYLTKELAASTYTTHTEFDSYLTNFAKKTDLDSYLTKTTAASTYVAKTDLTEITSTKVTELWNSIS